MAHSISNRALGEDPRDHARIAVLGCYVPLIDWKRAEEEVTLAAQTRRSRASCPSKLWNPTTSRIGGWNATPA